MNHEWRYSAEDTLLAHNEYGDGPEVYECSLCGNIAHVAERVEPIELPQEGCMYVIKDLPCTENFDFSPKVDTDGKLGIALWLDDERQSPPGWVRVKSVADAKKLLELGVVVIMSLDHDLGMTNEEDPLEEVPAETGYDLCLWMAANNKWSKIRPTVHSANPVGAANMKSVINRYWEGS